MSFYLGFTLPRPLPSSGEKPRKGPKRDSPHKTDWVEGMHPPHPGRCPPLEVPTACCFSRLRATKRKGEPACHLSALAAGWEKHSGARGEESRALCAWSSHSSSPSQHAAISQISDIFVMADPLFRSHPRKPTLSSSLCRKGRVPFDLETGS